MDPDPIISEKSFGSTIANLGKINQPLRSPRKAAWILGAKWR